MEEEEEEEEENEKKMMGQGIKRVMLNSTYVSKIMDNHIYRTRIQPSHHSLFVYYMYVILHVRLAPFCLIPVAAPFKIEIANEATH